MVPWSVTRGCLELHLSSVQMTHLIEKCLPLSVENDQWDAVVYRFEAELLLYRQQYPFTLKQFITINQMGPKNVIIKISFWLSCYRSNMNSHIARQYKRPQCLRLRGTITGIFLFETKWIYCTQPHVSRTNATKRQYRPGLTCQWRWRRVKKSDCGRFCHRPPQQVPW